MKTKRWVFFAVVVLQAGFLLPLKQPRARQCRAGRLGISCVGGSALALATHYFACPDCI